MEYAYGNWFLVVVNIVIFYFFIKSSFKPRTKTDWRSLHVLLAFVVALFAEMYGFPLTIFLLTSFFGNKFNLDYSHDAGHLLTTLLGIKGDPHISPIHLASYALIIVGLLLLAEAWRMLYRAQKKRTLATTGLYRYVRHPQYLGFILIIIGFLLQWPTIITLIMAPILIVRYIRLGYSEERVMLKKYGHDYAAYKRETPGYIPKVGMFISDIFNKVIPNKT